MFSNRFPRSRHWNLFLPSNQDTKFASEQKLKLTRKIHARISCDKYLCQNLSEQVFWCEWHISQIPWGMSLLQSASRKLTAYDNSLSSQPQARVTASLTYILNNIKTKVTPRHIPTPIYSTFAWLLGWSKLGITSDGGRATGRLIKSISGQKSPDLGHCVHWLKCLKPNPRLRWLAFKRM